MLSLLAIVDYAGWGIINQDEVVKEEIFNENIRGNYNVRFVLDDRNKVVDMWRQLGLNAYK